MLTDGQVELYRREGYLTLEGALDSDKLGRLRAAVDELVLGAADVTAHTDLYDLEDSHAPEAPRVRRLKTPAHFHAAFGALIADPTITGRLAPLIGPNIRFQGDKLNMKSAGYGAPVEWHQDWGFYPHTNDDVLAVGVLLDDCDEDNGPLMVVPCSHTGPIWDHHADGHFCGAIDLSTCEVDFTTAVPLTGPAGTMTIHHVRTIHGSTSNTSGRPRRLYLMEFAAADAWPLMGIESYDVDSYEAFDARVVLGEPTIQPRIIPAPVRLPLPPAFRTGSIYENQKGVSTR